MLTLPESLWDVWLDPDVDPASLKGLLVPYASSEMTCWPVSTRVNSTRNEGADLIERIEILPQEHQEELF